MRGTAVITAFAAVFVTACATPGVNAPAAIAGSPAATERLVGGIVGAICLETAQGGQFAGLAAGMGLSLQPNFLAGAPGAPEDFPDLAYAHPDAPRLIVFERAAPERRSVRGCTMGVYDGDAATVLQQIHAAYVAGLSGVAEPMGDTGPPTPEGVDARLYNLYMDADGERYVLRITSDAEVDMDISALGESVVMRPRVRTPREGFTVTIVRAETEG
jgi:hypothetical protein